MDRPARRGRGSPRVRREFVLKKLRGLKYRCRCVASPKLAQCPLRLPGGGRYALDFAIESAVAKYLDHTPLERQVRIMRREGLDIDSSTLWEQCGRLCARARAHRRSDSGVRRPGARCARGRDPLVHVEEGPAEAVDVVAQLPRGGLLSLRPESRPSGDRRAARWLRRTLGGRRLSGLRHRSACARWESSPRSVLGARAPNTHGRKRATRRRPKRSTSWVRGS